LIHLLKPIPIGLVAYTFNGNWYMWAGAGTFAQALTATAGLFFNGSPGHLFGITSEEEFAFLVALNFTNGFIGASDQVE
jgi:hypothetical protein